MVAAQSKEEREAALQQQFGSYGKKKNKAKKQKKIEFEDVFKIDLGMI